MLSDDAIYMGILESYAHIMWVMPVLSMDYYAIIYYSESNFSIHEILENSSPPFPWDGVKL